MTIICPISFGRGDNLKSIQSLGLADSDVELIKVVVYRLPEIISSCSFCIKINIFINGVVLSRALRLLVRSRVFYGCLVHGIRYAGLSIATWARWLKCKKAIVVHGVDPFIAKNIIHQEVLFFCKNLVAASDAIVLVGRPLLAQAAALKFPSSKIHVVANGTDLPLLTTISNTQRRIDAVRRIVSVSNLVRLKGIDDNMRALAAIAIFRPDLKWEYRIVGDGPQREALEKLSSDLGIDSKVKFLGRVAYETTMQEIADCDVFSLPSWGEAFGIVYLEAMARMRPVIGCLNNGAADIFADGVEGRLVPPKDVTALASALMQLIGNPALCAEMGQAGRTTAETMSWDANAKQMLSLLSFGDLGMPDAD